MRREPAPAACIPNIGPRERRRRLIGGVVMLAIAGLLMAALITRGASRGWRASAFVPLLFAGICFLQVQQKTCIALSARGERNLDRGVERVTDADERRVVAAQARRVTVGAVTLALALTVVFVMI
jgi:hypothetical protein